MKFWSRMDAEAVRKVIADMRYWGGVRERVAGVDTLLLNFADRLEAALAEPAVVKDSLTADADPNAPWLSEALVEARKHQGEDRLREEIQRLRDDVRALVLQNQRLRGPILTAECVDWGLTSEEIDRQFRAVVVENRRLREQADKAERMYYEGVLIPPYGG